MKTSVDISLVEETNISQEQKSEMLCLQIACFSAQVTAKEIEEDFNRPPIARVLAYHQRELISCADVFKRKVEYKEQTIVIGGMSPCTKAGWRGQGVGTQVCKTAMDYLRGQGCDVAFLSVDTKLKSHLLYETLGFNMLAKPFSYANIRGERKESDGGMVAPVCSQDLFELILQGDEQFSLMPESGYW